MSPSRHLTVLSIIATASLAAASAQAAEVNHTPHAHVASRAGTAKRAACERVWAAQRVRHGTHQAFVTACVAKG